MNEVCDEVKRESLRDRAQQIREGIEGGIKLPGPVAMMMPDGATDGIAEVANEFAALLDYCADLGDEVQSLRDEIDMLREVNIHG